MLDKLTNTLDFQTKALVLRAERQRTLASNIANADTPGYSGREFNFAEAMLDATARPADGAASPDGRTNARHFRLVSAGSGGGDYGKYTVQTQPTLDANSVDLDRERAAFADNAVRYEATLRFISGHGKTLLAAIQGQ